MAETKPCETANVKSGDGSKVVSQCGYCMKPSAQGKDSASGVFQMQGSLSCEVSKGAQATMFLCDNLYLLTCLPCGSMGKETWSRPHLQW